MNRKFQWDFQGLKGVYIVKKQQRMRGEEACTALKKKSLASPDDQDKSTPCYGQICKYKKARLDLQIAQADGDGLIMGRNNKTNRKQNGAVLCRTLLKKKINGERLTRRHNLPTSEKYQRREKKK